MQCNTGSGFTLHNGHCARYECAYQAQPETKGICYHKDNRSPDDGDTEPLLCANIQTASECSNMGCQRSDYQKIKISTQLVCKDALGNTLPESACDRTQALKTLQQCNQRKCEQSTNTDPKST